MPNIIESKHPIKKGINMRLVHISDLHYKQGSKNRVLELLERVKKAKPDHLVITGDLTGQGRESQFKAVKEILKDTGFYDYDRLTVIPGNHDLFGFIYRHYSDDDENPLSQLGDGVPLRDVIANLISFLAHFTDFQEEDYEQTITTFCKHYSEILGGITEFPFTKKLGNNIALIGLDTNHFVPQFSFTLKDCVKAVRLRSFDPLGMNVTGATGWTDVPKFKRLCQDHSLTFQRKIVLLHHHLKSRTVVAQELEDELRHPDIWAGEMRLDNRVALSNAIKSCGAKLVLHGHLHWNDDYQLSDGTPVLCGGGTEYDKSYNMIDIRPRSIKYEIKSLR